MPVFEAADILVRIKAAGAYEPVCDIQSVEAKISYELERRMPAGDGWGQCLVTGRWMELLFTGKRCTGSPGNDYIAGRALTFKGAEEELELAFPDGQALRIPGVVCVIQPFGGPGLCALVWRFVSSGAPVLPGGKEG